MLLTGASSPGQHFNRRAGPDTPGLGATLCAQRKPGPTTRGRCHDRSWPRPLYRCWDPADENSSSNYASPICVSPRPLSTDISTRVRPGQNNVSTNRRPRQRVPDGIAPARLRSSSRSSVRAPPPAVLRRLQQNPAPCPPAAAGIQPPDRAQRPQSGLLGRPPALRSQLHFAASEHPGWQRGSPGPPTATGSAGHVGPPGRPVARSAPAPWAARRRTQLPCEGITDEALAVVRPRLQARHPLRSRPQQWAAARRGAGA